MDRNPTLWTMDRNPSEILRVLDQSVASQKAPDRPIGNADDALHWLCHNHDDYRHIRIDEERWASSESTIVARELLDGMGQVGDITAEDASRSGFATEDLDTAEFEGDLPTTISALLNVNNG